MRWYKVYKPGDPASWDVLKLTDAEVRGYRSQGYTCLPIGRRLK